MKQTATFTAAGERFTVTLEASPAQLAATGRTIDLTPIPTGALELSLSGHSTAGSGQIVEAIRTAGGESPTIRRLCELWDRWHLNGMNAGTREQKEVLANVPACWGYEKRLEALKLADRDIDHVTGPTAQARRTGYRYGSAWLYEPLPAHVLPELETILRALDGETLGAAPDVDDAQECSGDVIDSRDVIKRLEAYKCALIALGVPESVLDTADDGDFDPADYTDDSGVQSDMEDLFAEFIALRALDKDEPGDDWQGGATLIRDSYFAAYARELAEDIGAINSDAAWPNNHIDWEAAAEALKADYSEVEFRGDTYFVR